MAEAGIVCPLCHLSHEAKKTKFGNDYVTCTVWKMNVFFRTEAGVAYAKTNRAKISTGEEYEIE